MTPPNYRNRPEPEYVIGVDESGTGAFAGPFTVCAFMSHVSHTPWIAELGARDSKTTSHLKRKALVEALAPCATIAEIIAMPPDYTDQKKSWREGVARAVKHCLTAVGYDVLKVSIQIDGSEDAVLTGYFDRIWDIRPIYVVKGDALIPQISAASIFAKSVRSELMYAAHQQYPMYGWSNASGHGNDGYGTADHLAAIEKHGICELHRRVRPLLPYFRG